MVEYWKTQNVAVTVVNDTDYPLGNRKFSRRCVFGSG